METAQEPKRKKYLYMAVTNDPLELPVFSADSAKELAQVTGVAPATVLTYICRGKYNDRYRAKDGCNRMTRTRFKYVKVELPDDEEEDLMADTITKTILTV